MSDFAPGNTLATTSPKWGRGHHFAILRPDLDEVICREFRFQNLDHSVCKLTYGIGGKGASFETSN
jgi:hypothetical protein